MQSKFDWAMVAAAGAGAAISHGIRNIPGMSDLMSTTSGCIIGSTIAGTASGAAQAAMIGTGEVFYGLDYRAIFNSMSGVPKKP